MDNQIIRSPYAAARLERARAWLVARGRDTPLAVVAATAEAANEVVREVVLGVGAVFGWQRYTLGRLAAALATGPLATGNIAPVGPLALEAICARVVHALATRRELGRFQVVADRPGLPRALARTLEELRLAGVDAAALEDVDLRRLAIAFDEELARAGLADRAVVLARAAREVRGGGDGLPAVGLPLLLLDVPIAGAVEAELLAALAARAPSLLATVPTGDERSRLALEKALGVASIDLEIAAGGGGLSRLRAGLFSAVDAEAAAVDEEVVIFSAPGESRECVEIARMARREAERGVPFDRMAILLRAPLQYRAPLEEAMRRADVPAHFARGTVKPNPTGRAFLSLLGCLAEGLSARRFAEYLSLGEVPDVTAAGAPPAALAAADRWVPPDDELVPLAVSQAGPGLFTDPASLEALDDSDAEAPVAAGTLRAPRRWERLLVDAAVIGGRDRWQRRLDGLGKGLELELARSTADDRDQEADRTRRSLDDLANLRAYALPLLDALVALPARALWREWVDELSSLATRALRRPERVLAVLAELAPMGDVGPVELTEVRLVLSRRLTELVEPPEGRKYGRVFVAPIDEARGLAFDVVFVPGLAEKLFPQRILEDPILRDRERQALGATSLKTNVDRVSGERLALKLAVGAAGKRVIFSYPRLDIEQGRPRTPSFYGLEVLRAAEGKLPGTGVLARRAEQIGAPRIGWPAPIDPAAAIDEAEHDLALLAALFQRPPDETVGTARYLIGANPHLARALRFRARRWIRRWTPADGLVLEDGDSPARTALAAHQLTARSYSPTALQNYASCPYRFVLSAIHRLRPREEPAPLEELDPLQRGSLVHEVQFELHQELRARGLLPITPANLEPVRDLLDATLRAVARRYHDELAPAIERVWEDGINSVRADLREWLRRAASPHLGETWTPIHFELSFGLDSRDARDPSSTSEPAALDCGLRLRGSIDVVERSNLGTLRATDYKTGKVRAKADGVIGGGESLQPVLYALAVEKLVPGAIVESGRLYYCTSAGDFTERVIPLDPAARDAATAVAQTIGEALATGFLPAAPGRGACEWCDFSSVCGPYEELRTSKVKAQDRLQPLHRLRRRP